MKADINSMQAGSSAEKLNKTKENIFSFWIFCQYAKGGTRRGWKMFDKFAFWDLVFLLNTLNFGRYCFLIGEALAPLVAFVQVNILLQSTN